MCVCVRVCVNFHDSFFQHLVHHIKHSVSFQVSFLFTVVIVVRWYINILIRYKSCYICFIPLGVGFSSLTTVFGVSSGCWKLLALGPRSSRLDVFRGGPILLVLAKLTMHAGPAVIFGVVTTACLRVRLATSCIIVEMP